MKSGVEKQRGQEDEKKRLQDSAVEERFLRVGTNNDRIDSNAQEAQDCYRLIDQPPQNPLSVRLRGINEKRI